MSDQERKPSSVPILYVDDEPMYHKIMSLQLKDWNLKHAYSAKEAIDILEAESIKIVLSDIRMPEMDGIELLRYIKKSHAMIQVIMVTASDDLDDLINAFETGANDFVLKPLKADDIEDALRMTIAKLERWKNKMQMIFNKRGTP